jgi:hypothetical protein
MADVPILDHRWRDLDFGLGRDCAGLPGPFTVCSNGAFGLHGEVVAPSTRVGLTSDALGVRLNFRF